MNAIMSDQRDPQAEALATKMFKKLTEKAEQARRDLGHHYDKLSVYHSSIQRNMLNAAAELSAGNLQFAYILYHKVIIIAMEVMPKHAMYNNPKNAMIVKQTKGLMMKAFEEAEQLKDKLKEEFYRDAVAEIDRTRKQAQEAENDVPTISELEARIAAALASRNSRHVEITTAEKLLSHHLQLAHSAAGPALVQDSLALNPNVTPPTAVPIASLDTITGSSGSNANPRSSASGINTTAYTNTIQGYASASTPNTHEPSGAHVSLIRHRTPLYPDLPRIVCPTSDPSALSDVGGTGGQGPGGLRWVHLPKTLIQAFLGYAQRNSAQNRETCGILAAKLKHNELYVSALLIPDQTGGPDSCDVQDDLPMFNYMQQEGYMTMGWIHTHPSQTAFLSSVDLHTHCPYQQMLKEAIAIVCSVKYRDDQVFHLTHYGGDRLKLLIIKF